jgi:uncharacterized protein (TIGR02246 family)
MKIHLIPTLAGLAISFALPTFAQEKDAAVDPQIVQQLHAIGKKSDEAFLKGDAAALAALYTEDGVYVTNTGPIRGRQAIEKYYVDRFQEVRYFGHDTKYDPASPHPIGTDGNAVWENGEWSGTIFLQGEDCGPHQLRGYFASVKVREGDTWKIRMLTLTEHPRPAAPAEPK